MADEGSAAQPEQPAGAASGGDQATPEGTDPKATGPKSAGEPVDGEGGAPGDDRSADEAYWRGQQTFRRHYTASAHQSKIKNFVAGDYYQYDIFTSSADSKASGLVRKKVLERIREIYALVPSYESMLGAIEEYRLIVLRGLPDNGLTTTAVRLLDEATGGQVARLELSDGIGSIKEPDLVENRGYLISFTSSRSSRGLTETHLDSLGELLEKRSCWCVVVDNTESGSSGLDGYAFDYQPPDPQDVLRKHTSWLLRRDDPDRTVYRELLVLADREQLIRELGQAPHPSDVVLLAGLLVRYHRGLLEIDDVRLGCSAFITNQVSTWFVNLRRPNRSDLKEDNEFLALSAFRIALAVLNISTFHQVVDAARGLERKITEAIEAAKPQPSLAAVALDRHDALTRSRSHTCDGIVAFGADTVVRGTLVEYVDDRFPLAVLEHVWQEYDWMREPLVAWLRELGKSDSPIIWVRAAQAAGALATMDFEYAYRKLIAPGVYAETIGPRRFAAIALDQAAQDGRTRSAVLSFLRRWRREGGEAARWTTAAALGYGLGLEHIETTLNSLRILGTPDESLPALEGPTDPGVMVTAVSRSLCQLLAFGAVEPVLTTLTDWLVHHRTSMRALARSAVRRLISRRGFHSTYLEESGSRERAATRSSHERWPLLLALQYDDPRLAEPIAELLRRTLRGRGSDAITDRFRGWIRTGCDDPTCLAALHEFLPLLVQTPDDAARLTHLITVLRYEWAEPLQPDVADSLEAAIRSADTGEVPPWTTATTS